MEHTQLRVGIGLIRKKVRNSIVQDQATLELKRKVWKIPTLPKIRLFLWRVAAGALAVAERLDTRGTNVPLT